MLTVGEKRFYLKHSLKRLSTNGQQFTQDAFPVLETKTSDNNNILHILAYVVLCKRLYS